MVNNRWRADIGAPNQGIPFMLIIGSFMHSREQSRVLEDMHGMTKEDMETIANDQENQGDKDPIETWFQTVVAPQHQSILHQLLAPYQSMQLVPHVWVSIQV
jgi:hypothetical protein